MHFRRLRMRSKEELRRNFAFELHLESREWRTERIYRCELTARVRDAPDNAREIALN